MPAGHLRPAAFWREVYNNDAIVLLNSHQISNFENANENSATAYPSDYRMIFGFSLKLGRIGSVSLGPFYVLQIPLVSLLSLFSFSTRSAPATVLTTGQQWAGTMGWMVAGSKLSSGLGLTACGGLVRGSFCSVKG